MRENGRHGITRLLARVREGDDQARSELYGAVYAELQRLAEHHLRGQRVAHTLEPSALVSEAYLKLADHHDEGFESRGHFFAAASRAMRWVLVDHARGKARHKRKAVGCEVPIQEISVHLDSRVVRLLDLNDALERLAVRDEQAARVVELRFFGGCSVEEASVVLGVSMRTTERDWNFARAWLRRAVE